MAPLIQSRGPSFAPWQTRTGISRGRPSAASPAGIAARPGYPTVIVPFALIQSDFDPPLPDGFDVQPRPFGVSFTGGACSEPRLIELAYAFEQASMRRVAPPGMN